MTDRLPPNDRSIERALLGSCLRDNGVISEIQVIVGTDDFYADAHQKIFKGIVALYEAGKPVDLVTLKEWLEARKFINDIGGYGLIGELWDSAPTAAHAEYYAERVRDYSKQRKLIHAGTQIVRDAHDASGPVDDMVEQAEKAIFSIAQIGQRGETVELSKAIGESYDRYDQRSMDNVQGGLPTGFIDLDEITGGLHDSELILIAARPSVGKSALAFNMARHLIVAEKVPIFFASLEMKRVDVAERMLCAQGRVNGHLIRKVMLNSEGKAKFARAGEELAAAATMHIDDSIPQTVLRIAANARRLKLRYGIRAVFVDYLQLIDPTADSRRESREQMISGISRRLKHLARELEIPVIALAQLNREVEHRSGEKPRLADLRDSGSLEQDADTVFLLHRPNKDEATIELLVEKQRNGPTGSVMLTFLKDVQRFENYAFSPEEVPYASRNGVHR